MSERQHTPGPWELVERHAVIWHEDQVVAECPSDGGISDDARHANARLIAAAPEMLVALKKIAEGRGRFSLDQLEFASNVIEGSKEIALAAIAKAEGEA